jgi:prepilin-type N-terminal cleavage/methylation domain-containing protein
MSNLRRRRGFTLIELLVVLLILGVLAGILLPAIEAAREAGRRTQCINNMRQLGLAFQGHLNARNTFPNAGTFKEAPEALASGDPKDSVIHDVFTGRFGRPRGGDPDVGPLYSWVAEIQPYIECSHCRDDFNRNRSYLDDNTRPGDDPGRPSNRTISSTPISILTCPDDRTLIQGAGNLSYVCNGGFSRWHAIPYGWAGNPTGGSADRILDWGPHVAEQTGVMFLGTKAGDAPWDYKTTAEKVVDGMSLTLLLTENTRAGASKGNRYSSGLPTNWACPHPNFVMFTASDDVCTEGRPGGANCSTIGDLDEVAGDGKGKDKRKGRGWARANPEGSHEGINSVGDLADEGSSPFPSSGHPGGVVVVMCDGSTRFIREDIDGAVWAKLITPAGGRLPIPYRQRPVTKGSTAAE